MGCQQTLLTSNVGNKKTHTFAVALLVRSALDTFFPFFAFAVNACIGGAVTETTLTGTVVVTLLARLLTIRARVLALSTFGARDGGRSRRHVTIGKDRHWRVGQGNA